VQGEELEPAGQIGCDRGDLNSRLVDRELPRREPAQTGVFRDPDPVLDSGVCAVAGLEGAPLPGVLTASPGREGVGDEGLVAPAATCSRKVSPAPGCGFSPRTISRIPRPAGEVDQPGELDDSSGVGGFAGGAEGGRHADSGTVWIAS
jgi:hypothetical protein